MMNDQPDGTSPRLLSRYSDQSDRFNRGVRLWVGIIALLLLAGLIYWLTLQFIPRVEKFGPGIIWINGKIFILLLPIALVLLLWLVFGSLPRKKWVVGLYPEGMQIIHGDETNFIVWEDLDSLSFDYSQSGFLGIKGAAHKKLNLQTVDGRLLSLDGRHIDNFEDLVRDIREQAFPFIYTRALETLERSGRVTFGEVTLLQEGWLQMGGKAIPVAEIRSVKLENGWLNVTQKNLRHRLSADRIANLDVLIKILSEKVNSGNTSSVPA